MCWHMHLATTTCYEVFVSCEAHNFLLPAVISAFAKQPVNTVLFGIYCSASLIQGAIFPVLSPSFCWMVEAQMIDNH